MRDWSERIGVSIEDGRNTWYDLYAGEGVSGFAVEYTRADVAAKKVAAAEFRYEELLEDAKQFAAIMNHQTDIIERLERIIDDAGLERE